MHCAALNGKPAFAEEGDSLRQQFPLCFLHHAALENLGGIPFADLHRMLEDNGTAVAHIVDKVNRRARHLDAAAQRFLICLLYTSDAADER